METNVTSGVVTVTPQIAQDYLTRNINNRPLNQETVNMYAQMMKEGQWVLSNDAISFSQTGELINGQHRIKAVIQSGVTCQFIVTKGLPQRSFEVMDNGRSRNAADVLFIDGIQGYTVIAAVVRRKIVLERKNTAVSSNLRGGGAGSGTKVSNAQIIAEFKKHDNTYTKIMYDVCSLYRKSRLFSQGDYGGFIAYLVLCLNHPYEKALAFFEEFSEKSRPTNDVVNQLRQRIMNDKINTTHMTSFAKQRLIIKAWNAYVTGKTVKRLVYNEITDKDLWFV